MTSFLINPYRFASAAYDTDAQAYITAVEAADGQALETGVKDAINAFVVGCKADGIWTAIKACCILAGARTLAGALQPLVGTAPTNVNSAFVSGDYNRKTGLVGNASTKCLNSNRALNADPLNSYHLSVYVSTAATSGVGLIGNDDVSSNTGEAAIYRSSPSLSGRFRSSTAFGATAASTSTGFIGCNRATSTSITFRAAASTEAITYSSAGTASATANVAVFSRDLVNSSSRINARLAFYSIGESLNLSLLDSRVSTLLAAYAAAIP
ncbi:MAG: hypothetical protein ACO3GP_04135 [Candidatus Limnocylindrus sp.]